MATAQSGVKEGQCSKKNKLELADEALVILTALQERLREENTLDADRDKGEVERFLILLRGMRKTWLTQSDIQQLQQGIAEMDKELEKLKGNDEKRTPREKELRKIVDRMDRLAFLIKRTPPKEGEALLDSMEEEWQRLKKRAEQLEKEMGL
jgi:neutral trehalase